MSDLFDRRFIVNTGKGGVGKTTVTAAMARAFARRGKRVLVMELNAHEKISGLFGAEPVGTEIGQVAPNIFAVNTTPQAALREYALMILKIKAIYRAVFENRIVAKFLRVVPGLPELVMLGKAYFHEKETDRSGEPTWDVVILDAPATGHGMFLLQIPQVITDALSAGNMVEEARAIMALLRDRDRTMINLVTLPEEMPVNETVELRDQLRDGLSIEAGYVVANSVLPSVFSQEDAGRANELLDAYDGGADATRYLLSSARFRWERCELQRRYLDRIEREIDAPMLELPFRFEPNFGKEVIDGLSESLEASLERVNRR